MTRIVRGTYRYKRPPKRKKPVTVKVPVVVKAADPVRARKRAALCPSVGAQSAIVTSRKLSRIMRRDRWCAEHGYAASQPRCAGLRADGPLPSRKRQ
jgi:hypothetical protein